MKEKKERKPFFSSLFRGFLNVFAFGWVINLIRRHKRGGVSQKTTDYPEHGKENTSQTSEEESDKEIAPVSQEELERAKEDIEKEEEAKHEKEEAKPSENKEKPKTESPKKDESEAEQEPGA